MPKVSVIIPTFNRPDNLKIALDSVLKQTYKDYEIILINDAGCCVKHIAEMYEKKVSLNYIKHQENKGLAATRNTGILAANGEYIAYLDDDDIFYPNHLATLVEHMDSKSADVAYTDAYCSTREYIDGRMIELKKEIIYSEDFDNESIFVRNFIPVCCIMHRRECFNVAGIFDKNLRVLEDWDLWIRFSQYYRFDHIREITCEYTTLISGGSLSTTSFIPLAEARCKIIRKHIDTISKSKDKSKLCIERLIAMSEGQLACLKGEYAWRNKIMGSLPYRIFRAIKRK